MWSICRVIFFLLISIYKDHIMKPYVVLRTYCFKGFDENSYTLFYLIVKITVNFNSFLVHFFLELIPYCYTWTWELWTYYTFLTLFCSLNYLLLKLDQLPSKFFGISRLFYSYSLFLSTIFPNPNKWTSLSALWSYYYDIWLCRFFYHGKL